MYSQRAARCRAAGLENSLPTCEPTESNRINKSLILNLQLHHEPVLDSPPPPPPCQAFHRCCEIYCWKAVKFHPGPWKPRASPHTRADHIFTINYVWKSHSPRCQAAGYESYTCKWTRWSGSLWESAGETSESGNQMMLPSFPGLLRFFCKSGNGKKNNFICIFSPINL